MPGKVSPFFSIVIPTYNAVSVVKKSVTSVLKQQFENFEILVLDGASTDNTLDVLKELADNRITIHSEADKGVYDAMNKSLELAAGEWIYFLGSDDSIYDDAVLKDIYVIASGKKWDVIYGDTSIEGDTGWSKGEKIYGGKFSLYRLLRRNICHQGIFYRRSFLLKHNLQFDLSYPVSADWDVNLKCWMLTTFKYTKRIVANFAAGGISTGSKNEDRFKQHIPVIYKKYLQAPFKSPLKRAAFYVYSRLKK